MAGATVIDGRDARSSPSSSIATSTLSTTCRARYGKRSCLASRRCSTCFPEASASKKIKEVRTADRTDIADVRSAGYGGTAPRRISDANGGADVIPNAVASDEAQAFVAARVAEGSDYIKIVRDDLRWLSHPAPTLDSATIVALPCAPRTPVGNLLSHTFPLSKTLARRSAPCRRLGSHYCRGQRVARLWCLRGTTWRLCHSHSRDVSRRTRPIGRGCFARRFEPGALSGPQHAGVRSMPGYRLAWASSAAAHKTQPISPGRWFTPLSVPARGQSAPRAARVGSSQPTRRRRAAPPWPRTRRDRSDSPGRAGSGGSA